MKRDEGFLRRQPQQKRSQERVEQILDAAAEIFDEVGFEGATTQAIADRANTSIGSLYQFFPDKKAIFNALELRHIERVYVMWENVLQPEVIQLPFPRFIKTINEELIRLFSQASSRIVFIQYFTAKAIFKNIDDSFTEQAIRVMADLLKKRNSALKAEKSYLLAEICVNAINTLLLIALRSNDSHRQAIFQEIEIVMMSYLRPHVGDEVLRHQQAQSPVEQLTEQYQLNRRQSLALTEILDQGSLTIQRYEELCFQVSRRTLQRDLQKLVKQGLLVHKGRTNQLVYYLNPNLRQVETI
ncbi:MAG: TetR family transcriptional regulator [Cyanobacteria bacterium P01_G01_bin.49]